jgi:PAS domain S-box-containing protein
VNTTLLGGSFRWSIGHGSWRVKACRATSAGSVTGDGSWTILIIAREAADATPGNRYTAPPMMVPLHDTSNQKTPGFALKPELTPPSAADVLVSNEERYRMLLERVRIIAWEADPRTWQFTFVSPQAQAITGFPSEQWLQQDFWPDHIHPDDRDASVHFCIASTLRGEPHEFEYRFLKSDGGVLWIRDIVSVEMRDGQPHRLFGVMIDITDRKNAEEALRESHSRHELIVDALAEGIVLFSPDDRITTCNGAAERILGMPRERMIGTATAAPQWQWFREDGTPCPTEERCVTITRATGQPCTGVLRRVKRLDGKVMWVSLNTRAMATGSGPPYAVVASFHDVTQRKNVERQQRLLMRELDHRVRNNLASVLSIAQQTAHASRSLPEFREAFAARVQAMARAHEALAAGHWESVDFGEEAQLILGSFIDVPSSRVRLSGPPVRLPAQSAMPLAMTLHELLTNAVKYGALSNDSGQVSLEWQVCEGWLILLWRERDGPPVSPTRRPGVGTQLIDGFIRFQLRGAVRLEHPPDGMLCELRIPLIPQAEHGGKKTG